MAGCKLGLSGEIREASAPNVRDKNVGASVVRAV